MDPTRVPYDQFNSPNSPYNFQLGGQQGSASSSSCPYPTNNPPHMPSYMPGLPIGGNQQSWNQTDHISMSIPSQSQSYEYNSIMTQQQPQQQQRRASFPPPPQQSYTYSPSHMTSPSPYNQPQLSSSPMNQNLNPSAPMTYYQPAQSTTPGMSYNQNSAPKSPMTNPNVGATTTALSSQQQQGTITSQQQLLQQQQQQQRTSASANTALSDSNPASAIPASIVASSQAQQRAKEVTKNAGAGGDISDDLSKIPELQGVDPKLLQQILYQVVESEGTVVKWEDIAGLKDAKQVLHEAIVLPSLRPDIFYGLRAPARGVLLFGPPGTGKTLLAKAVSSQCQATFFSISSSTLVSKWQGEGERLVKALFSAANYLAPSVIFIDEIDSILTSRSSGEHEASRRMKTEFLVQIDGVTSTSNNNRVLVMGATNRPNDLDDAILRRFIKRIYIPLPDKEARLALIQNALKSNVVNLSPQDYDQIASMTEGYSGSDMKALCQESAMVGIREINSQQLLTLQPDQLRAITLQDFQVSLGRVRPTVSQKNIKELIAWNEEFGTTLSSQPKVGNTHCWNQVTKSR